jgi:hypothetical protein
MRQAGTTERISIAIDGIQISGKFVAAPTALDLSGPGAGVFFIVCIFKMASRHVRPNTEVARRRFRYCPSSSDRRAV